MGQAFRHAWVPEGFVHKDQGQHLQKPILNIFLQLRNLPAQVIEHSSERRAVKKETVTTRPGRGSVSLAARASHCLPWTGGLSLVTA